MKRIIVILCLGIIASLTMAAFQVESSPRTIRIGDTLDVNVLQDPLLSKKAKVSQNGTINYFRLGEVSVAGLTIDHAQRKLKGLIEMYYLNIKNPSITISIEGYSDVLKQQAQESEYIIASRDLGVVESPRSRASLQPQPRRQSTYPSDYRQTYPKRNDVGMDYQVPDYLSGPSTRAFGDSTYQIAPGDTVEIVVYGEPDLSTVAKVVDDGSIRMPLLGKVVIEGLTTQGVVNKIQNLLKQGYLTDPEVGAFVKEHATFFVLGAVNKTGSYELRGGLTLTDAILLAGGLRDVADASNIVVKRVSWGEQGEYSVDLATQGDIFIIKPFDKIVVNEFGELTILGAVRSPGRYNMKRGLTLWDAIMLAGGANKETANTSEIQLFRSAGGVAQEYILNLEVDGEGFLLQPGDRIIVDTYGNISVFGQVRSPGKYQFKEGLTAVDAIALTGGFTPIASQNGVKIIRGTGERKEEIRVKVGYILRTGRTDLDVALQEGDVIVVPESFF